MEEGQVFGSGESFEPGPKPTEASVGFSPSRTSGAIQRGLRCGWNVVLCSPPSGWLRLKPVTWAGGRAGRQGSRGRLKGKRHGASCWCCTDGIAT